MKPNFIVVGAAKSGTTWLYTCLKEHPEIFLPKNKEIHFFSYPGLYQRGTEWYESFFPDTIAEKAVGEISPSYLPTSDAASRIHEYNPHVRLICILRNPIERAYSHYCMDMGIGKVSRDINSGLTPDNPRVTWGLYHSQITELMNLFSPEQIKIYLFDDIKKKPDLLLQDLYSYLEVDNSFSPSFLFTPKNTQKSLPKYPKLYNYLRGVYQQLVPISGGLLTELRLKGYLNLFHQLNQGDEFPKLSREKEISLAKFYQQDVTALSEIIERDLSFWLEPYLS